MSYTHFDAVLGDVTLGQVRGANYAPAGQPISVAFSGDLDVASFHAGRVDPRVTLETSDLAAIVGKPASLSEGWCVSGSGVLLPYARRGQCGTFATGSVHAALAGTKALVLPRSLSWSDGGGAATATVEVLFFSDDGSVQSVVLNQGGVLPGGSKAAPVYGPGPVDLNGTRLSKVTGVTVNTGITSEPEHYGGLHPVERTIRTRRPTIEIPHRDLAAATASAASFTFGGLNGIDCYFRRRNDAGFYPDNQAEHIRVSFADGLIEGGGIDSSAGVASASYAVHGRTLVAVAGVAIPAGA